MFFAVIQFKPVAGAKASTEWGLQHDTKFNLNVFVPATIALRLCLVLSCLGLLLDQSIPRDSSTL